MSTEDTKADRYLSRRRASGDNAEQRFHPVIYRSEKSRLRPDSLPQSTIINSPTTATSRSRDSQPILREVAELRREIEQMRMERQGGSAYETSSSSGAMLPPSYDSV